LILYIFVAITSVILAWLCAEVKRTAIGPACNQGLFRMDDSRAHYFMMACLVSIFVLLFVVSACRLNVGNDYAKYVEFMHRLYTDKYIDDPGVPTEWGFNILTRIVYGLSGYENFLLVFAIYSFATVAIFMVAMWKQAEDFAMTFLMFMALGYYFQSFSTVRYYLALAIALYCMYLVNNRRWFAFTVAVAIGTGFHKSILVIVPLYLLARVNWRRWQLAVILIICSTGLFLQDFYLSVLIRLYPSYEDTEYLAGSGFSWINILRCVAVLAFAVIFYNKSIKEDGRMRFFFYLNLMALALYVFGSFLPIVSRIGYYLTVSHILFVPALIGRIEDARAKRIVKVCVIIACILYFAMYLMKASDDGVLVLPYRTFFFHDMVNILSDVA